MSNTKLRKLKKINSFGNLHFLAANKLNTNGAIILLKVMNKGLIAQQEIQQLCTFLKKKENQKVIAFRDI